MAGGKSPVNGSQGAGQEAGSKAGDRGRVSEDDEQPRVADSSHTSVQASSPAELPVDTLKDAAPFLRRPFMPDAIRFKVQAATGPKDNPKGGIVVAHIDARLVTERLNAVCPHLWHDEYQLLSSQKHMLCKLTVGRVTRQDVGEASGLSKDLFSDAFKRAAVKFGVGVSVYALPQVFLPVGEKGLEVVGQKKSLKIPDSTLARLRGGYAKWLEKTGCEQFGAPLDHGDTLVPLAGDAVEDTEPDEDPDVQVAEGPEADGLRGRVKELFDEIRELDATVVTPAEYARRRREADVSVEGLTGLAAFLLEKKAEAQKAVSGAS